MTHVQPAPGVAPMTSPKGLMSAFGVAPGVDGRAMSATQLLIADLVDHRGRTDMPAYAMMAESLTSGTFWHSFDDPVGTVQSWLALTAGAPVTVNDRLFATTELLHSDGEQGAVSIRITDDRGQVVCGGLARSVLVGRTGDSLAGIKRGMPTKAGDVVGDVVAEVVTAAVLPPPIDPALDGRRILSAISAGEISSGSLCELLCATVESHDDQVRMTVSPQAWMANPLGAIQGGVMATIMGQACSFAGQLHTGHGQSYSLAELSVYFFRSPGIDEAVTVLTYPDRVGRRLGTVSATMTGAGGVVYARATANVRYH